MKLNHHGSILIYTIHDDGMRDSFLMKVKETFKGCKPINESTYSLNSNDIDGAINKISQIYTECKQQTNHIIEKDYISLLCSPTLKSESYKGKKEMDDVIEYHIIGTKFHV